VVYDAHYWRGQAALCLEIASQISDRRAADNMRATAADYLARAVELEGRPKSSDADRRDGPPIGTP
jgi:hypothetical protein